MARPGTAEGLLGRRCAYHSSPDVSGPDAVAAALCPPPTVFSGQEAAAAVCRVDEAGGAVYRRARFIPLGAAAGAVLGVVALLDGEDLPSPASPLSPTASPDGAEEDADRRHELLGRFRRQTVALYGIDRLVGNSPAMRRAGRRSPWPPTAGPACCWWDRRAAGGSRWPPPSITGRRRRPPAC